MNEFFNMGGYAAYVWPSYLLAFMVLALNVLAPLYRARRLKRMLLRKLRMARRSR